MARVDWGYVKPILMQVLGYAFLVLGVVGLVLPFLQGFLFLAIGLIILARYATWAHRLLGWTRERYPKAGKLIDSAEGKAEGWWRWLVDRFRG